MTDFIYVNDLPEDDTPSADARSLYVNEAGTELVQGPTWASSEADLDGKVDVTGETQAVDLSTAPSVTVPDATADGQALAHSQNNAVLGSTTTTALTATNLLTVEYGTPEVRLIESDLPADEQRWRIQTSGGNLYIRATTDDNTIRTQPFDHNPSTGVTRLNQAGVTSVLVPAPTAADQALRWGSEAEVAALTATGNVTMTGTTFRAQSAAPRLELWETDAAVDAKRLRIISANGKVYFRSLTDGGADQFSPIVIDVATGDLLLDSATSVTVPAPTAADQALRWGSNAEVAALTATENIVANVPAGTGTRIHVIGNSNSSTNSPALIVQNTQAPTGDQGVALHALVDGRVRFRRISDAGTADGAASLEIGTDGSVTVPVPTAADQAAQTTAIDATTGRMAINGYEQGDSGPRNIVTLLENGWTSSWLLLRRQGNVVYFEGEANSTAATSDVMIEWNNFPEGFRPLTGNGDQGHNWFAGTNSVGPYEIQLTRNNGLRWRAAVPGGSWRTGTSWTTTDAWPSSLPGTAVAAATTLPA